MDISIIIITCLFILSASIFNMIMDASSEDRFSSAWWNKSTGWRNKWKDGDLKKGERFPLSSTVLVFLTDGWHLSQFMFHTSWQLAVAVNTEHFFISFIVVKVLFSLLFEAFYLTLKKRKK